MKDIERNRRTEHQFTAFITHYLSFQDYLGSYKRSFDILMEEGLKTGWHVDHLSYPILFLARHCMELGFKTNIRYFSRYSEKNDYVNATTHNLEDLFRAFKLHISSTFKNLKSKYGIIIGSNDKKEFNKFCNKVEKLTNIFHQLDKNSDAFRYPVDREQNPSFKAEEKINLIDVNELLEKSMTLFFHTADVFAKYTDYADEIEGYYEGLMREQYEQYIPF